MGELVIVIAHGANGKRGLLWNAFVISSQSAFVSPVSEKVFVFSDIVMNQHGLGLKTRSHLSRLPGLAPDCIPGASLGYPELAYLEYLVTLNSLIHGYGFHRALEFCRLSCVPELSLSRQQSFPHATLIG